MRETISGIGNQHFHQAGIVIVIYVGTIDPSAAARLPQPVEFAIRRDALQQSEAGECGSVDGEDERQAARLGSAKQSLPGKKAEHRIGAILQRECRGVMGICRHAEDELSKNERGKNSHGEEKRIPADLYLVVEKHLLADPEQKQDCGTQLDYEDGPRLDRAESERTKQEQAEDAI